jgi:predicted HAD superfamily Cof-like phosphohydrolase
MTAAYLLNGGNKSIAAKSLGISRTTFNKKFSDLNIMGMVEDVAEFHRVGGTEIPTSIKLDPKATALVLLLLKSEQREVIMGLNRGDLANVCNEFLDMIYVAIQGLLRTGMTAAQINELWGVLHQANMTKVDPQYGLLKENNNRPYVDERGSFRKPPRFQPVDFERIIRKMRKDTSDE